MAIVASFTQNFNLDTTPIQFKMTDTSTGLSRASNLTGSFRITLNGNVVYDNITNFNNSSADIVGASSLTNGTEIQLQLNPDGSPVNGLYTIYYQLWDSGASAQASVTETFNFQYGSPVVVITGSVQVYTPSPLLTMTDATNYMVNSVTPVFTSKTATITYPTIIDPITHLPSTPTPTVNTTTNPITTSTTFWSPTSVSMSIDSALLYTYTGTGTNTGFTVTDQIGGVIQFPIDATSFCKLYCGLFEMQQQVNSNPQNSQLADDFAYAMGLVTLIMLAQNCGKTSDINRIIEQIQAIGNFNSDCDCGCGSSVQQVIGLGSLVNSYSMTSANNYIAVVSTTAGNNTNFQVTFSQTFVDLVNSILGATLLAGDNIVLSSSTSGANTTWTINALGVTVVSANESITVTPTTTGNNTEYDLSLKTYAQTQLTTVTLSAPSTDYAIFGTPIQVSESGTYMMFFEADLARASSLDINAQYHPYKNSAPTVNISTFGNTDYRVVSNDVAVGGDTQVTKLTMNTTVNLLRLETINININAATLSAAASILKASILLIKIG